MHRAAEGTPSSLLLDGPPPAWATSFVKCCVCGAMLFPVALGFVLLLAVPIAVLSGALWLAASAVWPAEAAHPGPVAFVVSIGVASSMVGIAAFLTGRRWMSPRASPRGRLDGE